MKRILVTGSRDWKYFNAIRFVLEEQRLRLDPDGIERVVLVSGHCPTGADEIAEYIWETYDMGPVERHPADWATHGRRAGYVRNQEMVDLGADVCVAFIRNNSKGALMTADLAEKAGIDVRRIYSWGVL